MSFFSHLECSAPCGAGPYDARIEQHLCSCGAPLLVRYDLDAARTWSRDSLAGRAPNMWRYRELMPLFDGEEPITLGEGWTPLVHARRLGADLGLSRLFVKDESLNPTNSFKARGLSAAVTRAAHLGATTLSVPSAGNAANAMAAYAAAAGIAARVFMPRDVKVPFIRECELYGAEVTLVDGLITDAGRIAAETGKPLGWYDVSTLKEPYRIEGKKTMGVRARRTARLALPRLDHLSDRRRHRHGRHVEGVRGARAHRLDDARAAPAHGLGTGRALCADRQGVRVGGRTVRAVAGRANARRRTACAQGGRRLPGAPGRARERRHGAGGVGCVMVSAMRELGSREGISAAPEGGAGLEALRMLLRDGLVKPADTVVLFNTGGALSTWTS